MADFSALDEIYQDFFADEYFSGLKDAKIKAVENEQLLNDYENVFSSPSGKRVLWDLLSQTHIFHSTFTGNARGMFLEGERSIGLYILHMATRNKFSKKQEEVPEDGRGNPTVHTGP